MGDPVIGRRTAFLRSFSKTVRRNVEYLQTVASGASTADSAGEASTSSSSRSPEPILNYSVKPDELHQSLERGRYLSEPLPLADRDNVDPVTEEHEFLKHEAQHDIARTAMARIFSLSNANHFDMRRVQRKLLVETFGRHQTEKHLPPKPPVNLPNEASLPSSPPKTPRAGPDTGSPEVQIAILTLRIRSLARHLAGPGRTDKANKQNLLLLVHRRQKMMKYLRRQDRGASRWQHVTAKMGLTDRMWKGRSVFSKHFPVLLCSSIEWRVVVAHPSRMLLVWLSVISYWVIASLPGKFPRS